MQKIQAFFFVCQHVDLRKRGEMFEERGAFTVERKITDCLCIERFPQELLHSDM